MDLARAGWRLGRWSEGPNNASKGRMAQREFEDFGYSLGIEIGKDGRLRDVRWASPAYAAG